MKHIVLCLLSVMLLLSFSVSAQKEARIKIDIERQIGSVDTMLYGNFTEHLGRCVYKGLYEPGSPLSDENGFRKDVMKAVKELNVSVIRWPGGNFVSGYHWEDGIGPKEKRPVRMDLAWGKLEDNSFGTDEFMKWCGMVHSVPYVCVNLGTGSLDEARNWVEYCNIEKGTYYSDLRIKNGHVAPYKVKYWGLGNEVDGPWQMGHKSADDYGKYALEAGKLMKWVDGSIKLIAAGCSNYGADWMQWNRTVLDYMKNDVDYLSLHNYVGNHDDNYYKYMASTYFAEDVIKVTEGIIHEAMIKAKRTKPIYIAFDEYNTTYGTPSHGGTKDIFNLEDALVVASYLNAFVRHANIVKMANMAQLVNLLAPIYTTPEGMWYQTIFYPLSLFSNHCFGESLQTYVDGPTYSLDGKDIPYLDVSSVYDSAKKKVIINVVNRNKEKNIETTIISQNGAFGDSAIAYEVNGDNIKVKNSAEKQAVKTISHSLKVKGDQFKYSFPAHSFTMIEVSTKN